MDDYWKEVENITRSGGGAGRGEGGGEREVQEEEQQKIPEGRIHWALYLFIYLFF